MSPSIAWTLAPQAKSSGWTLEKVRQDTVAAVDSSLAELPEAALVDACLSGRPEAFDVIVERHRRPVYQLCYRFVGNHEDASDLTQEISLRAYRGLRKFRGQSSLSTWLYRIGVNVCLNRVTAKGLASEPIEQRHDIAEQGELISDQLIRQERAVRLRAAVARLPPRQR